MNIVYAVERDPAEGARSLFLAGPSPRGQGEANWRIEAVAHLQANGL